MKKALVALCWLGSGCSLITEVDYSLVPAGGSSALPAGGSAGSAGLGGSSALGGTPSIGGSSATSPHEPLDGGDLGTGDSGDTAPPRCQRGTWYLKDSVDNVRDLGAIPLRGGSAAVACGAIYRGAKLASLSAAGCEEFQQLGFRTIIDLRVQSEYLSYPDAVCAVEQAAVVHTPLPIPYGLSPAEYIADLNATPSIARTFDVLADAAAYPVYVHCTYGRDRTGVFSAVLLLALGASREDIMADYQLTAEAGLGSSPASLTATLDEVDRQGGIAAYLAHAGISDATLAAVRARLVAAR